LEIEYLAKADEERFTFATEMLATVVPLLQYEVKMKMSFLSLLVTEMGMFAQNPNSYSKGGALRLLADVTQLLVARYQLTTSALWESAYFDA
jgi:hypothetical protein